MVWRGEEVRFFFFLYMLLLCLSVAFLVCLDAALSFFCMALVVVVVGLSVGGAVVGILSDKNFGM